MRILLRVVVSVLALGAATWLFDGITLTGATTSDRLLTLVIVGVIFGIITSFVKPIVTFLTFPFILLTLGLLLLVINALMLLLTSSIADGIGLDFHVAGFWTAVGGAIVISIVTWGLDAAFGTQQR